MPSGISSYGLLCCELESLCYWSHWSCGVRMAKQHMVAKRPLKQQHSETDDNLVTVAKHVDQKFLPATGVAPLVLCNKLHEHLSRHGMHGPPPDCKHREYINFFEEKLGVSRQPHSSLPDLLTEKTHTSQCGADHCLAKLPPIHSRRHKPTESGMMPGMGLDISATVHPVPCKTPPTLPPADDGSKVYDSRRLPATLKMAKFLHRSQNRCASKTCDMLNRSVGQGSWVR